MAKSHKPYANIGFNTSQNKAVKARTPYHCTVVFKIKKILMAISMEALLYSSGLSTKVILER